jgi:hypothetical protein
MENRSTHLSTWVSADLKERFAAAAMLQRLSESALLKRLVEQMLAGAGGEFTKVERPTPLAPDARVTVRLVPDGRRTVRKGPVFLMDDRRTLSDPNHRRIARCAVRLLPSSIVAMVTSEVTSYSCHLYVTSATE